MAKCDKCGKNITCCRVVMNYYVLQGFPHDTERILCNSCRDKFSKYMVKCYDKFFKLEKINALGGK